MFMKHNSKQFGKQFYINPSNFVIELAFSPPPNTLEIQRNMAIFTRNNTDTQIPYTP
jgi:hypothetical protein